MTFLKPKTIHRWSAIIGGMVLTFSLGLPMYWGNMSVYVLSFYLIRLQSEKEIQTQWVIPLYFSCEAIGFILVGLLSKRAGKRIGLSCGMVLFLGGIFGTYFALKSSIIVMNVTLGVLSGLGAGFVVGMALEYAVPWGDRNVGFVTSLVDCGFHCGPLGINPLITSYTNPENKSPDFIFGPSSFFSQQDILDNVQNLFLVLGCFCLGFLLIGFLMVREFKTGSEENGNLTQTQSDYNAAEGRETGRVDDHDGDSLTPKQLLMTSSFYVMWFMCVFDTASMVIVLTYYKSFGQIWIKDDYFLAWTGVAFTVSTVAFGPIWGRITDRVGVKMALIVMYALSAVHVFFLYFAPRLNKWLYLVAMVVYGSSSISLTTTVITACYVLYGKKYHSSNVGLVNSSDIIMAFVTPPMMEMLLVENGWFVLLCFAAVFNAVSLVFVVFALPKC